MFNINGRQGIVKLQVLDARSLPLEIEKCSLIIYILPIEYTYKGFQPAFTRKAVQKLEQTTLPLTFIKSSDTYTMRPVDCVGLPPDFSITKSPAAKSFVSFVRSQTYR